MKKINPIKIYGEWIEGYAMDVHTISSDYLGENEYGHPMFDTKRSDIGDLLFRLKYRSDKSVICDIINLISPFMKQWKLTALFNGIISMPPSNNQRPFQPVFAIAEALASELNLWVENNYLEKVSTVESKNMNDKSNLSHSMIRKRHFTEKVNILLIDDLYATGSSMNEAIRLLKEDQNIKNVYVMALTKKRS